jgi:XTP/dITP diphosphohydrolase
LESLLLATTNPGKIREIRRALQDAPVRLLTLGDLTPVPEPEETGATFGENALAKAQYYGGHTGLPTVAEDSGLAIDALNGRPGVESARYPGVTYPEKFARLYQELAPHARPWTARFVCSIAVIDRGGRAIFTCEGTVLGEIAPAPRGSNGFGYDPIFHYAPFGRTLGEVSDAEKLSVSHRGQAFRQLAEWLGRQAGSRADVGG